MASNIPQCEPCAEDGSYLEATRWCCECQQWLCDHCGKYHKRLAATKAHTLLSKLEYEKLPNMASAISRKCHKHSDKDLEFYCSNHISAICFSCMKEEHALCKSVNKLKDVASGIKSSAAFTDIMATLEDFVDVFEKLQEDRKKNKDNLKAAKHVIDTKVQNLLDENQKYLKQLAADLQSEVHKKYTEEASSLDLEIDTYKTKRSVLEKKLSDVKTMVEYASDEQMVLSLEDINRDVSKHEEYLQSLNGHVFTKTLAVDLNLNALHLNDLVPSFGQVSVQSVKCPVRLTGKNKAMVATNLLQTAKSTDDVRRKAEARPIDNTFILVRQFAIPLSRQKQNVIRDIKCLPNGYLAMTDSENNRVLIIDQNGSTMLQESLQGSPRCLTFTKDGRIAVTLFDQQKVLIWNPYQPSKKENIDVNDECTGIACVNDILIINCQRRGLLFYNVIDTNSKRLIEYTGKLDIHELGVDNLYIYKSKTNDFITLDINSGLENKRFKVYSKMPSCLAKDDVDNFYIIDSSNAIRKIDTRTCKSEIVLDMTCGINKPQAVATFVEKSRGFMSFQSVTKFYLFVVNNEGSSILMFQKK
ncbi:uncharacterized protein LOC127698799 [Mytilus californianus]|uniref:uncharacterized protein LOC127698799 n=1 Tax=Mytilus californianus TaxID=6549 RepID=UPI002247E791|nr:uncharacterized protein LOC127698799 [Mytilus californianus]